MAFAQETHEVVLRGKCLPVMPKAQVKEGITASKSDG